MSVCQVRLILWLLFTGTTIARGHRHGSGPSYKPFPHVASSHGHLWDVSCAFSAEEDRRTSWPNGGSGALGLHKQAGHHRSLPMPSPSTSHVHRRVHDLPWPRNRAPLVVSLHHGSTMAMGPLLPGFGRRERTHGQIRTGVLSLLSEGPDAPRESSVSLQGSLETHRSA
jgi:hypothetical protein